MSNADCTCYPDAFGLRAGCNGPTSSGCKVLRELRLARTDEGRAELKRDYAKAQTSAGDRAVERPDARSVAHRVQRAGCPGNYLQNALGTLEPLDGQNAVELWWASDKKLTPALVLAGSVGVGKSTAAAWGALEWARTYPWNSLPSGTHTEPLIWLSQTDLPKLSAIGDQGAALCDAAAVAELLVVDDAGREGNRPAIEALSDVLCERVDKRRLTILTANLVGPAFVARYGEPLANRLRTHAIAPTLSERKSKRARVVQAMKSRI